MSYTLTLGLFAHLWDGPQRLILQIEGERVIGADYRGGYNERNCAARLPNLSLDRALHLVSRIDGGAAHAHALAFCAALEALAACEVPARACYLRSVVAELERMQAHLRVLHAIFTLMGQQRRAQELAGLQAQTREALLILSGRPTLPDICLPGGIGRDLDEPRHSQLPGLLARINMRLYQLIDTTIDERSLLARTVDVGRLPRTAAEQFGLRGPLARASGLETDTRPDTPYAAYDRLNVRCVAQDGGDVYARLVVLLLETFESAKLAVQALEDLPTGPCQSHFPATLPEGTASAAVESPRGQISYRLESDGKRLTNVSLDLPRQLDRLLARTLLVDALLDDVGLILLSTGAAAACAEG